MLSLPTALLDIRLFHGNILFNANCARCDDLDNFSSSLKDYAEGRTKYVKQEAFKKDMFFVIPSNTLEVTRQTAFSLRAYDTYIVSIDGQGSILPYLRKIKVRESRNNCFWNKDDTDRQFFCQKDSVVK